MFVVVAVFAVDRYPIYPLPVSTIDPVPLKKKEKGYQGYPFPSPVLPTNFSTFLEA